MSNRVCVIGHGVVMGSSGGGMFWRHLRRGRFLVGNPFWRVRLHWVGMWLNP